MLLGRTECVLYSTLVTFYFLPIRIFTSNYVKNLNNLETEKVKPSTQLFYSHIYSASICFLIYFFHTKKLLLYTQKSSSFHYNKNGPKINLLYNLVNAMIRAVCQFLFGNMFSNFLL